MKVVITGVNPYGAYKTEEHELKSNEPVVTGLMPMSIHLEGDAGFIHFDYEIKEDVKPPNPFEEPTD